MHSRDSLLCFLIFTALDVLTISCGRITPTVQPVPTTDPYIVETQVAATVFARLTASAPQKATATATIVLPTPTMTPKPTATNTRTPVATKVVVPTSTTTVTPLPVPQRRFDSSKDGTFITDIASGAQTKISSIDGVAASAAWSPNGDKAIVSWLKTATVKKGEGQYVCGYSWKWDPWKGYYYGPDYCNNPPSYFPGTFGGGLRLVSRNGETLADLASGSPEPHYVGDPQVTYTDAIWAPDGNRMAVLYKQADSNRCPFIGYSNATGLRKLNNCEADDHPRFWSVDGKWLITWSEREPKLYAYEIDGSRRVALDQLGRLQVYDERYFPWRVTDQPTCKGDTGFWSCQ